MKVSDLTVEKVMIIVLKVLQSKDTIELVEGFLTDHLQKQSILAIPYDDEGLCCAKAIVFALAHLENNKRNIETLRKRNESSKAA